MSDPPSGLAYAAVHLNRSATAGSRWFRQATGRQSAIHQQMVFLRWREDDQTLSKMRWSRTALSGRLLREDQRPTDLPLVRRLRIYPHALLREANAYYSPDKRALLFRVTSGRPRRLETTCREVWSSIASHDIIAHETTHALLDGLHPRYQRNRPASTLVVPPKPRRHRGFVPALRIPAVLGDAIRKARGHAGLSDELAGLAFQFGQATGSRGRPSKRHRSQQGTIREQRRAAYQATTEPHARGELLVAAVFAAFRQVHDRKTKDLMLRVCYAAEPAFCRPAKSPRSGEPPGRRSGRRCRRNPCGLHSGARLLPTRRPHLRRDICGL